MNPFTHTYQLQASDLIAPYDHVHHARTLELLEQARLAFLEAIGIPYQTLIDQGILLVITRIEVDYKREIRSDSIEISCEEPRIEGKRIWLRQRVRIANSKEAIDAQIQFACLSTALRRAIEPPAYFRERFLGR